MKETVTFQELLAITVRRGKFVLCMALLFALLMGGLQILRGNGNTSVSQSGSEVNAAYEAELAAYEEKKAAFLTEKAWYEKKLEQQAAYYEESPLMHLDPYNLAVAYMDFYVTDIDPEFQKSLIGSGYNPTEYLAGTIAQRYKLIWDDCNLSAAAVGTCYEDVPVQYLRELTSFSTMNNGGLSLRVIGADPEETLQAAKLMYQWLIGNQPDVAKAVCDHTLTLSGSVVETRVDDTLRSKQESCLDVIHTYAKQPAIMQSYADDLVKPEPPTTAKAAASLRSTVLYVILGAVLGTILALLWVLAAYIFRDRVETSRQLERQQSIPFLGAAVKHKGFFDRIADHILRERTWADNSQAMAYLAENVRTRLPEGGAVALVSTLPLTETDSAVQAVLQAISGEGRTVRLVADAGERAEVLSALKACTTVILAEKAGESRYSAVAEMKALTAGLEKPIAGFVLI